MNGFYIACFIGIMSYLFGSGVSEQAYLSATGFLVWWYLVTSFFRMIIPTLVALGMTSATTLVVAVSGKNSKESLLGGILGFLGGATLSAVFMLSTVVSCVLLITGAYLLSTAVAPDGLAFSWDMSRVMFGAVALLLGLCMSKE